LAPASRPVGIDLGTHSVKLYSAKRAYFVPSLIGDRSERAVVQTQDKTLPGNLVLLNKTHEYCLGEMVRRGSEVGRPIVTGGRIVSVEDALLAIKAILPFGLRDPNEIVRIVSGIPAATGLDGKQTLARSLLGKLGIDVRNEATGETRHFEPEVESSNILPSSFGTYYSVLREKGERFAIDAVVIDCGHGMTDILTMYDGEPSLSASRGVADSVETMAVELGRAIEERAGLRIEMCDLMGAIRRGLTKVTAEDEEFDITELKKQHVSRAARAIADEVESLLGTLPSDAEIEHAIITGGGAHLFAGELRLFLVEKEIVRSASQITVPEDPIMANVEGLEMIAREVVS